MTKTNLRLSIYLKLVRPVQWLKNLMLFFPPFLGGTIQSCLTPFAILPFVAFCLASSASYVLNDLKDRECDCLHPEKKHRPVASGQVSSTAARSIIFLLIVGAGLIAWSVSPLFSAYLGSYFLISLCYTLWLKNIVLLDLFGISAGFLLRLKAGGIAFDIAISEWLFLCVLLLSLFLSAGKRLSEKRRLGDKAEQHRKALAKYPKGYLEGIMTMTGASVLVAYSMYVIARQSHLLLLTVPLCAFGLFRYLLRVQSVHDSGDPTESLTRDIPLLVTGVCWTAMVGWGVYGR